MSAEASPSVDGTERLLQVGGTLDPHEHVYIERSHDREVLSTLRAGEYCNVLTSRQVGKSSLMTWLSQRLKSPEDGAEPRDVAQVDVAGDLGTPEDADSWYAGFLEKLAMDLDLDVDVETWWEAEGKGTRNQRLLQFFREVLVPGCDKQVVVFVDEIEATLKLSYTDDFFTALRTIYNQRSQVAAYKRVTFCLLGNATPNELMKDRRTTPYNVGRVVELRDFTAEDDLSQLHRIVSPDDPARGEVIVRRVLYWTDGHPLLTAALCLRAAGMTSPEQVDAIADPNTSSGLSQALIAHFEWINDFVAERISLGTLRLYGRVLKSGYVANRTTVTHAQLRLVGLVKTTETGVLIVRNRMYARRFDRTWLAQTAPMRTRARLKLVGIVGGVLLACAGLGAFYYVQGPLRRQQRAAEWILVLDSNPDEKKVTQAYRALAGLEKDPELGEELRGYEKKAKELLFKYWGRRAEQSEKIAKTYHDAGDDDAALIFAAIASVQRDAPIFEPARSWYDDGQYGHVALTLRGHTGPIRNAYFAPNGKYEVTLARDGNVRVWDADGLLAKEQRIEQTIGATSISGAGADGALVVVVDGKKAIGLALPQLDSLWQTLDTPTASVAAGSDGKTVVTAGADQLQLWDIAHSRPSIVKPVVDVRFVVASPAGGYAAADGAGRIAIFDSSLRQAREPLVSRGEVLRLAFSANGKRLLSVQRDDAKSRGNVRVWETVSGESKTEVVGALTHVTSGSFCDRDDRFVVGSEEFVGDTVIIRGSSVRVYGPAGEKEREVDFGARHLHQTSPACDRALVSDETGVVRVWSFESASFDEPTDHAGRVARVKSWCKRFGVAVRDGQVVPFRIASYEPTGLDRAAVEKELPKGEETASSAAPIKRRP
jgi:WD40 repeat protein